jgi:glycerate dehydrogenase
MDFSPLEKLGKVTYYNSIFGEELVNAVKNAEIVLINKTVFNAELLKKCPNLKYIGVCATGYNNVDVVQATKQNVTVCNVPSYSTSSVVLLTLSFILELSSNLSKYTQSTRQGDWIKSKTFSYFPYKFSELEGKTLGVYGMGEIGTAVAMKAQALGMKVIATTRTKKQVSGVTFVDKEELFRESDFLTLHCPLTEQTADLMNEKSFSLMKDSAFFVNTSRGGTVCEKGLLNALKSGKLSGAAVDVLTKEPMSKDCVLLDAPNLIITPHSAWAPYTTRKRLLKLVANNLSAFLSGKPQNKVN